jgi:proteasome lid subunit RPN8/RPN11
MSETNVSIKKINFYAMLKHVLQFGNTYLDKWQRVMGLCYGTIKDNYIEIFHVIPMFHGDKCNGLFGEKEKALFEKANKSISSKKLDLVGWYHSHPGESAFMNKTDAKNHLLFQNKKKPLGICIVFDHKYLEEVSDDAQFGFKVFQLDNHELGIHSDYHECPHTLDTSVRRAPYQEVTDMIKSVQLKQPFIQEFVKPQEIESKESTTNEADILFSKIRSKSFEKSISPSLKEFLAETLDVAKQTPIYLINTMEKMKDAFKHGLKRFKEEYQNTLLSAISDVENALGIEELYNDEETE